MTHHPHGDGPIYNMVGTGMGLLAGLVNSPLLGNIAETALLAFVGAAVGFLTTSLLKWMAKKLKR